MKVGVSISGKGIQITRWDGYGVIGLDNRLQGVGTDVGGSEKFAPKLKSLSAKTCNSKLSRSRLSVAMSKNNVTRGNMRGGISLFKVIRLFRFLITGCYVVDDFQEWIIFVDGNVVLDQGPMGSVGHRIFDTIG